MSFSIKKYLVVLVLVSLILFGLDKTSFFNRASSFTVGKVLSPVMSGLTSVFDGGVSFFESIFLIRTFIQERADTIQDRNFYKGEYFRLLAVEEENNFLRHALGVDGRGENKLILADVVAFNPLRSSQTLTLNKGAKDGVLAGQAVIITGRILVGRVSEVLSSSSVIKLITSQESRLAAKLDRSQSSAIVSGSASGALILDLVLKDINISLGEIILTSGLDENIPPNMLIGEVSKITSQESSSFKKSIVRPFFNFNILRQVFIVTTP